MIKWERYAVDEVLQELNRKEDLEKVDRTDLLNRKVDFLNEKLKQVYIKMDRLFETRKETNSNSNPFTVQSTAFSIEANPFSNTINNLDKLETPRIPTERALTSGDVLSPEKITIQNDSNLKKTVKTSVDNEFLKKFNKPQKPLSHTSKLILLNPNSDPDIISK